MFGVDQVLLLIAQELLRFSLCPCCLRCSLVFAVVAVFVVGAVVGAAASNLHPLH